MAEPDGSYWKRLSKDIERTEEYILQASRAIEQLERELSPGAGSNNNNIVNESSTTSTDDSELGKKREIVARYHAYKTLAYFPDKNDAIGSAVAASVTAQLVQDQANAIRHYRDMSVLHKDTTAGLVLVLEDYEQLSGLVDEEVSRKRRELDEIEDQIVEYEITGDVVGVDGGNGAAGGVDGRHGHGGVESGHVTAVDPSSSKNVERIANSMHASAKALRNKYLSHLKYTVLEYSRGKDSRCFEDSMELVQRLLYARLDGGADIYGYGPGWVVVDTGNSNTLELIKLLLLNDVVVGREDEAEVYKLREYGLQ